MDPRRLSVTPAETHGSSSFSGTNTNPSRSPTPKLKLPLQGGQNSTWLDRGSGEMDLDLDLESGTARLGGGSGPQTAGVPLSDLSRRSSPDGDDDDDDDEGQEDDGADEWNSRHPCYPHRNPHVAPDSHEYETTRVIRITRDYMYSGDLSPAFSSVYPEILEPFVNETQFREVVKHVNEELYAAHTPWGTANIVEGLIGMFTLWMYEDIVDTAAKRRIDRVEQYLESVNSTLEKEGGARFIPLRRTGYLNLDIQIPDPGIELTDDESEDDEDDPTVSEEERRRAKLHLEGISPPALMINGQYT